MEESTTDSTAANAGTLKRELKKILTEILSYGGGEIKDRGEADESSGVLSEIDEAIRILNCLREVEPDIPSPSSMAEPDIPSPAEMEELTADSTAANAETLKRELEKIVREITGEIKDCGETDGISGVPRAIDEAIRILNRLSEVKSEFISSVQTQADLLSLETETVVSSRKKDYVSILVQELQIEPELTEGKRKLAYIEDEISDLIGKTEKQETADRSSFEDILMDLTRHIKTACTRITTDIKRLTKKQDDTLEKRFSILDDGMNVMLQNEEKKVDRNIDKFIKVKDARTVMENQINRFAAKTNTLDLGKLERQQTENKKDCDSKMTEIEGMITKKK